jgi:hypothetical protein
MRLRFWRREPLPNLDVDTAADLGAVPVDHGAAVPPSGPDAPTGYTEGAALLLEDNLNAERSEAFPPNAPNTD